MTMTFIVADVGPINVVVGNVEAVTGRHQKDHGVEQVMVPHHRRPRQKPNLSKVVVPRRCLEKIAAIVITTKVIFIGDPVSLQRTRSY
jgi:hypothetical protein